VRDTTDMVATHILTTFPRVGTARARGFEPSPRAATDPLRMDCLRYALLARQIDLVTRRGLHSYDICGPSRDRGGSGIVTDCKAGPSMKAGQVCAAADT